MPKLSSDPPTTFYAYLLSVSNIIDQLSNKIDSMEFVVSQDIVIKLSSIERFHLKTKSPILIDSDSSELTFTIGVIIKKIINLNKISVEWDSNTGQMLHGPMAAHTSIFYTLLLMNNGFCRLVEIKSVILKDTDFI